MQESLLATTVPSTQYDISAAQARNALIELILTLYDETIEDLLAHKEYGFIAATNAWTLKNKARPNEYPEESQPAIILEPTADEANDLGSGTSTDAGEDTAPTDDVTSENKAPWENWVLGATQKRKLISQMLECKNTEELLAIFLYTHNTHQTSKQTLAAAITEQKAGEDKHSAVELYATAADEAGRFIGQLDSITTDPSAASILAEVEEIIENSQALQNKINSSSLPALASQPAAQTTQNLEGTWGELKLFTKRFAAFQALNLVSSIQKKLSTLKEENKWAQIKPLLESLESLEKAHLPIPFAHKAQAVIKDFEKNTISTDSALEQAQAISEAIKNQINQNFFEQLDEIALAQHNLIENLNNEEWWTQHGRNVQAMFFAFFAGTTMSGAGVTMGLEANDEALLATSVALGVPMHFVVWLANYYITKNIVGDLLRDFLQGAWKPKSTQEALSLFLSLASTGVSSFYTGYTTYIFIRELTEEIEGINEYVDEETGELITESLSPELLDAFLGVASVAALFTFFTYFAVMHMHGKKISRKYLKESFEEVGDLALVGNVDWYNLVKKQILFKAVLGLIFTGLTVASAMTGIAALNFLSLAATLMATTMVYLAATALNLKHNKDDKRLLAQVQLAIYVTLNLAAIFFLMYAAAPAIIGVIGVAAVAYVLVTLSWLGTCAFYAISTIETFKQSLRKSSNIKTQSTDIPLLSLRAGRMASQPSTELSLVEKYFGPIRIINGAANGLPGLAGSIFFALDQNMETAELAALSVVIMYFGAKQSYDCNQNGVELDTSHESEIYKRQQQLRTINTVRLFFTDPARLLQKIDDMLSTINNTSNPLQRYRSQAQQAVCEKVKAILTEYQKDGASKQTLTPDEINVFLKGPQALKTLYQTIEPLVHLASYKANLSNIMRELSRLILDVSSYKDARAANSSAYTWGIFSTNTRLSPGYTRDEKVAASKKLLANLQKISKHIAAITSNSDADHKQSPTLEPFTSAEKLVLTNSKLAKLFKRAEPFLSLQTLSFKDNSVATEEYQPAGYAAPVPVPATS